MQNIVEVIEAKKHRIEAWHENCLNHLDDEIRLEASQRDGVVKSLYQELEETIERLEEVNGYRIVSLGQFDKIYQEATDIEICIDGCFVKFAILVNWYDQHGEDNLNRILSDEPAINPYEACGFTHLGIIYLASDKVIKEEL